MEYKRAYVIHGEKLFHIEIREWISNIKQIVAARGKY